MELNTLVIMNSLYIIRISMTASYTVNVLIPTLYIIQMLFLFDVIPRNHAIICQ